jgi:hypothetical protein
MLSILSLLLCLLPEMTMTTIRQFNCIAHALLAMTGRVTMQGISRWTTHGGSYRTVQRFFTTLIPWASLFWLFFRTHLFHTDDVYLLAGDETVVTKAGKHTHGLDRFFASLYGKAVPGLSFFCLSLSLSSRSYAPQRKKLRRAPRPVPLPRLPPQNASQVGPKAAPPRPKRMSS